MTSLITDLAGLVCSPKNTNKKSCFDSSQSLLLLSDLSRLVVSVEKLDVGIAWYYAFVYIFAYYS